MALPGLQSDPMAFILDYGLQILAIVVPIILYLLYQRQKKEFTYTIVSKTQLFTVHDEVRGRLEIRLDGNLIENLHLLIIRFQNSGNVSIKSEDFEADLILEFNEGAQILSNEVIETNPDLLDHTVYGEGNKLRIDPMLYNEGDSLTIKLLISEFNDIKHIFGRIVGVSKIKEITRDPKSNRYTRIMGIFFLILTIYSYIVVSGEMRDNQIWLIGLGLYLLIGVLMIVTPQIFPMFNDYMAEIKIVVN